MRRNCFSPDEDEKLRALIQRYGCQSWKRVAKIMRTKTTRQCRERYQNYLDPRLTSEPWTEEEDDLLLELYSEIGPKWALMATQFSHRCAVNLKNRFSYIQSSSRYLRRPRYHQPKKTPENNDLITEIFSKDDIQEICQLIMEQ